MVHQMFDLAMGDRLYLAPLKEHISRILDIGTGTEIWAMQMGQQQLRLNADSASAC